MKDDRTLGERVSDTVTHFVGSWKFIFLFSFVLSAWVFINACALFEVIAFDKPPYILLNLVLSFVAAFQAPFIMMSQNRAEKKQDEAYRELFKEIKELVQQDLEMEMEIHSLESEIRHELGIVKDQQAKLLSTLKEAIALEQINRQNIVEILQYHEEDEEESK